ncbi:MAG: hypothetical protein K2F76_00720, partial [Duncaniella dubosii]|nr:hypothetical protein [Duncaniella dubosii]
MRLNLRHLLAMSAISASVAVSAQSITTSPAIITEDSKDIVITFHSDGGNRGLVGASASTGIYAHTGVITNLSDGQWKNAPTWGTNTEK